MKRYKNTSGYSLIVTTLFALMGGCASVPPGDLSSEVQEDLFAESKTYNGGE